MSNVTHPPVLQQVLALLDTVCDAGQQMMMYAKNNDIRAVSPLLSDTEQAVRMIEQTQPDFVTGAEHAYLPETMENIADTIASVRSAMTSGDDATATTLICYQLYPFLLQLRASFYFFGTVFPDPERMKSYYADRFADAYRAPSLAEQNDCPFQLSIAIPAYNHLETTKQCIDQLMKVTDFKKLRAELILLDHGSADDTYAYFKSLGIKKVIRFKRNNRMFVFPTMSQVCEGKYLAFVSNDILVSEHWAELLLSCMESDPDIIAVAPATPNTPNLQALGLPDLCPDAFLSWAASHNRDDSSMWDDRARIMPTMAVYRTEAINKIGFADPFFYTMEFWDDDFSLRARRAGYRQVLCRNVACYHFGSVTGGEAKRTEGTLPLGRKLFLKKNGVDAWGNGSCYDYQITELLQPLMHPAGKADAPFRVLGIDCGMGDTLFEIKNRLRNSGRPCELYHITEQEEYFPDLNPHTKASACSANICASLETAFPGTGFDCILVGRDIALYHDPEKLIRGAASRLKTGGILVLFCENPFYSSRLNAQLRFVLPEERERYAALTPQTVLSCCERYFSQTNLSGLREPAADLSSFLRTYYPGGLSEDHLTLLQIRRYYVSCTL